MAILKDKQVIVSKDGRIYQLTKCDACTNCCFVKILDCDLTLKKLFDYKYKFRYCKQLIGSNTKTRLGFKEIGGI